MKTILSRDFRPFLCIIRYATCVQDCGLLRNSSRQVPVHDNIRDVASLSAWMIFLKYFYMYIFFTHWVCLFVIKVFEIGLFRCLEINKRRILLSFYEDLLDLRAIISAHGNSWYAHRCRFSIKRKPTVLCWGIIHVRLLYLIFLCPLRKITNPRVGKERRFWFKLECDDTPL